VSIVDFAAGEKFKYHAARFSAQKNRAPLLTAMPCMVIFSGGAVPPQTREPPDNLQQIRTGTVTESEPL
jgi:hypothetical protein